MVPSARARRCRSGRCAGGDPTSWPAMPPPTPGRVPRQPAACRTPVLAIDPPPVGSKAKPPPGTSEKPLLGRLSCPPRLKKRHWPCVGACMSCGRFLVSEGCPRPSSRMVFWLCHNISGVRGRNGRMPSSGRMGGSHWNAARRAYCHSYQGTRRLESRMRENRPYGSEGGGAAGKTGRPYPIPHGAREGVERLGRQGERGESRTAACRAISRPSLPRSPVAWYSEPICTLRKRFRQLPFADEYGASRDLLTLRCRFSPVVLCTSRNSARVRRDIRQTYIMWRTRSTKNVHKARGRF
jgi:hypothetical protein